MGRSKKSSKKKSSRLLRQLILLLFLIVFLGGGYYYLKIYIENTPPADSTLNKAQYVTLENNDSIKNLAVIMYNNNVSINTISETFYKSDIFWPYIYLENKQVIYNPLNIDAEIVLRIPNIPKKLLDLQDTASINRVKMIADSILNSVSEPI